MALPTRKSATPETGSPSHDTGAGAPDKKRDSRPDRRRDRRDKRGGERSRGPRPDIKPTAPDTAAIDAARARAYDRAATPDSDTNTDEEGKGGILGAARTTGSYMWGYGKEGLADAAGAAAALSYLGVCSGARGALYLLDWLGRGLDKIGNNLINSNKVPYIKYLFDPLVSLLNWSAKSLGLEKSLYDQINKSDEDKKKLVEKLLKELRDGEKKSEKEKDALKKKEKRRKQIEDKLGKDVAEAIIDDIDALDQRTTDKVDDVSSKKADKKDD